jgi:hypothetical protein
VLHDEKSGLSVSEEGSFLPADFALWGWKRVISPEVFYSFSIQGGESTHWERYIRIAKGYSFSMKLALA